MQLVFRSLDIATAMRRRHCVLIMFQKNSQPTIPLNSLRHNLLMQSRFYMSFKFQCRSIYANSNKVFDCSFDQLSSDAFFPFHERYFHNFSKYFLVKLIFINFRLIFFISPFESMANHHLSYLFDFFSNFSDQPNSPFSM